jgi:sulfotransferase
MHTLNHHHSETIDQKSFHFISGLPQAGSSLLSALLQQNPRFRIATSSPLGALFSSNLEQMMVGLEGNSCITQSQRDRLLRGLFTSYFADRPEKRVVFDNNRVWAGHMPTLRALFPQTKLIVCVRDMAWIMDSIERLYRANPESNARLFKTPHESESVYSRVQALALPDHLVGASWSAIKGAFYGKQSSALLVVDYNVLTTALDEVLPLIYDFLDEPWFTGHDFSHLSRAELMNDAVFPLNFDESVLPQALFEQYSAMNFWLDDANSCASVISQKPCLEKQYAG